MAILTLLLLLAHLCPAQIPGAAADTVKLASGVRYVVHERGAGAIPRSGQVVYVHYTGFLPNGRMFESSAAEGRPVRLRLGRKEVIAGWEEVLALLPEGSRAWVYIPAQLAYGRKGVMMPDDEQQRYLIPPNTDLGFELQVVKVK
ncbi:FKBP-type peptidyl-prolyl cis-trans isomerase [Hymenobacter sp. BT730]|uniref:FKBP-type peptidyl-prolyl cis-trans isomerase n=1 Tax=Hymenobacter sp. BT730 TaxID=3063332 RepID=UPI0026DF0173|nr:FKBP-type peptidyl-prolyl cis-trans isomerase [Hymenobacter sp. BT730]